MAHVRAATRRTISGVVISDKNDKTIVVLVETYKRHSKYGKRVKYAKKYYAHDEENIAKVGDTVTIMEARKLSATKRFRLVSIDKKAELDVKEAEAEIKAEEEAAEEVISHVEKPADAEVKEEAEETPAESEEAK